MQKGTRQDENRSDEGGLPPEPAGRACALAVLSLCLSSVYAHSQWDGGGGSGGGSGSSCCCCQIVESSTRPVLRHVTHWNGRAIGTHNRLVPGQPCLARRPSTPCTVCTVCWRIVGPKPHVTVPFCVASRPARAPQLWRARAAISRAHKKSATTIRLQCAMIRIRTG